MTQKRPALKLLFIADPLENFHPVHETTLLMMREAQGRKHSIFSTQIQDISASGHEVTAFCHHLEVSPRTQAAQKSWYRILKSARYSLKDFDVVLLRKDPPFDHNFLQHLYLLNSFSNQVKMMNHPQGVLMANEKIFPLPFCEHIPETLISARADELLAFIQAHKKGCILKPIGDAGGKGVFFIKNPQRENIRVILETMTDQFRKHVIMQEYLPAAQKGDKRILLMGEQVLGAFQRIPAQGEHRANLHAGGQAKAVAITKKDRAIIAALLPELRRLGLDFVGLDLIGDKLIEVNVTSPMGLYELEKCGHPHATRDTITYLENNFK